MKIFNRDDVDYARSELEKHQAIIIARKFEKGLLKPNKKSQDCEEE